MIRTESVACDLCGSTDANTVLVARDYRFGRKDPHKFVQCASCGLIHMNPRPTPEAILELYQEDYRVDGASDGLEDDRSPWWKSRLKALWHKGNGQYIDELISQVKGSVLDIGCGTGDLLLLAKRRKCKVFGVEANPRAVAVCQRRGIEVFCGTVEAANFPDATFDVILLSQVIEHLPSPTRAMEEIRRILRPGGRLFAFFPNAESYHRTMFGKYWQGWHVPFHFYAFTRETFIRLATQSGFKVLSLRAITPDSFFVTSLKSYLYGEQEGVRPIDQGKWVDSLVFRAGVVPFLRILDWVCRGRGDCLRAELTKL